MKTRNRTFAILAVGSLCIIVGNAQENRASRISRLSENSRRLTNHISVSRQTVLAGEVFWIRARIQNNTFGVLEVFEPFKYGDGESYKGPFFELLTKDLPKAKELGIEWAPLDLLGRDGPLYVENGPSKLMASSEIVEKELPNNVDRPGEYQLVYRYGGAARFTVAAPTKGISPVQIQLPRPVAIDEEDDNGDPTGKKELVPGYLLVFTVLDSEGKNVLCASWQVRTAFYRGDWKRQPGLLDSSALSVLWPYVRVAESTSPITSLQANVAEDETLTVRWSTADGQTYQNVVTREQRLNGPLR